MLRNVFPVRAVSLISQRSVWPGAALLLICTMLAACGATPVTLGAAIPTVTATLAPTATATAVPTTTATPTRAPIPPSSLPTLAPAAGWHTVLTLSDTTGAHGGDIQQQTFIATKPYIILYSCKGSGGALKVLYQGTVDGAYCTAPPRINRTKTLKSTQPDHSAFVVASPMGNIIWELLVEMED